MFPTFLLEVIIFAPCKYAVTNQKIARLLTKNRRSTPPASVTSHLLLQKAPCRNPVPQEFVPLQKLFCLVRQLDSPYPLPAAPRMASNRPVSAFAYVLAHTLHQHP